jgi:hypothetical protein
MTKMDESELLRFLEAEAAAAYHHVSGTIASERERGLRAYMRQPYGTEVEGRSSVVASDVFDAVEGMLPDLIEVFASTDKAVVFDPVGPEDVEGAEQATNACNHVFYKQNNGFLILYSAAKDALLMKTGGVKWYWDYKDTPTFVTYRDVSEMQLAAFLASNPKAEVIGKEEAEPTPEAVQEAAMYGIEPPKVFSMVKIKTVEKKGKVCVSNIPPDELHISRRHNSVLLADCPYVAHVCEKTLSDLRQMGFDVTADDVKAASDEATTQDRELRDSLQGGRYGWWRDDSQELDESRIRGWLREEYILSDFDGDGIAERRQVFRLGKKILSNVEFSHVPIAAWTPYILTHRFDGFSVADLVEDFQRISTDIWRAQLDNLDLANNQETVVQTDSQGNPLANIDDLLNRRPGGVLREQVQGAIRPYVERWQGIEAMPMVELLESKKENRTGYTRYSQGLDGDSLNKTATGVNRIMDASQKRMKLMARIMAEALVAPMFKGIFKTLTDYGMEKLSFRLNGKFVQYDPQEWSDGYDMSINVGIGTGDKMQQAAYLQQISQVQLALMQSPMAGRVVTENNVYALQARIAENAGFKNPAEFWTDPSQVPPPQPQPSPDQIKAQAEAQKLQFQAQQAKELKAMDLQDSAHKFQAEMEMQKQVDANRQEWEARQKTLELQQQAQLEAQRQAFETEREQLRLGFEKWRVEYTEQMKLQIAREGGQQDKEMAMAASLGKLADNLNRPKTIKRDEQGRATGIE